MAKVLVTGGAGFIGSHIVDALVARGDSVTVLDNLSTGRVENLAAVRKRIELVEGDLADPGVVRSAVQGVDCIFHQAALASVQRSVEKPLDTHAACVTGTLVVLDEARKAKVRRIVYAASSSAYGDQPTASKSRERLAAADLAVRRGQAGGGVLPGGVRGDARISRRWRCGTSMSLAHGKIRTASTRR